jgi:cell division initiation protein
VKVTPLDIRRKEFKRSMRGYSDEEVDVFLDEVADEFERLFQENMEMHDRVLRLEEQIAGHMQIKDALEKTLIAAQLQSDEMRVNARKESELILRDAELKARHIVNDSYGETQRVQQALIQLKHLEEDFRFKFRSLLEGHLKLLDEAPITVRDAGATVLTPEPLPDAEAPLAAPVPPVEPSSALSEAPEAAPAHALPAELGSASGGSERVASPLADTELGDSPVVEEAASSVVVTEEPETESLVVAATFAGETLSAPEDDIPTEETEFGTAGLVAAELGAAPAGLADEAPVAAADVSAVNLVTESADAAEEAVDKELPPRGFFFGRSLDNGDDAFLAPDTGKNEKGRDFEW